MSYKKNNNLIIIPARSGSKGVKNKNIREIAGMPLIYWTIRQAINSKISSKVIVSTDSKVIAQLARKYGAETPFLRPKTISTSSSTTESAILHAIDFFKDQQNYIPENIILLQCTSPMRNSKTIKNAYEIFKKNKSDSLVSVSKNTIFLWNNLSKPQPMYNLNYRPMRQQIKLKDSLYRENGSIYIFNTKGFLKFKNRIFGKVNLFLLNKNESYEIDDEVDFKILEALLKNEKK